MKKIFIALLLLLIILFLLIPFREGGDSLHGSFLCKELPHSSMSFDREDNFTFYYYYMDNDKLKEDIGTYYKNPNSLSEYIINSGIFSNEAISYKNGTLEITINNKIYKFKKKSDIPIIMAID